MSLRAALDACIPPALPTMAAIDDLWCGALGHERPAGGARPPDRSTDRTTALRDVAADLVAKFLL